MTKFDVAIIGAGLSGLAAASLLHEGGKSVCVLEAADRSGGRIKSVLSEEGQFIADLGPSWVWPMFQPTIARWLEKLDLETFAQFEAGEAVVDLGPGKPIQSGIIPSQDGNERVVGGSQAMIDALVSRLPPQAIKTATQVSSIDLSSSSVLIETNAEQHPLIQAEQVIVAVPPRVSLKSIDWKQGLDTDLIQAMAATSTWMAPHAKVAITYDSAFWRDAGLSGRIVSRIGPIVESHDHCSPDIETDGSLASLWGFIGWPRSRRLDLKDDLEKEILTQLQRCFGDIALNPVAIHIEDWAANSLIATSEDLSGPMHHPSVRPEILRSPHFEGRLLFAGAETAERSPGLIEGAFDSAERVASLIRD